MTSFIHNKAGLIGFRSALIGSLLFAIVEGITLGTNETTINAEDIRSRLSWSILVFCISCILSIVPGYFGGRILEWLKQKSNLSLRSLMMVGAILGTITVILISLPYI